MKGGLKEAVVSSPRSAQYLALFLTLFTNSLDMLDCRLFDVPPDRLQELAENDGFHDDIPRPNVFNRRRHHDVPGIHAGVEVIIRRNHARRPHDHFRHYHDHHGHRRRFYDDFDIPDEEFHPRDFHYRRRPARRFPAFNHRMAADELEDIRRLLQAEEDEIGVSDSD